MYGFVKAIEFFLEPGNTLVLMAATGAALQWSAWRRAGVGLMIASAVLFLIVLIFPVGYWLLKPLEDRYVRPPWPAHVDGVIVLGGVLDPIVYASRGAPSENKAEARLVAAAEFARRYPKARIVFSGGTGSPEEESPEAHFAPLAFEQLGVPRGRVLYEDRSRNTWENLLYSQRLVKPKRGEVWVLATSASQLPRAMLVASRLHWKMTAWPTGYITPAGGTVLFSNLDLANNLDEIDTAIHEWLGLVAYSIVRPV